MEDFIAAAIVIVGFFLLTACLGLLLSWPLSLLWNGCLVPAVSGLHEVGILQMWGITFICGCLFRSSSSSAK